MANTSDQSQNLILYNYFRSSTSYRARCALNIKNLAFEYKPIHLINNGGEQNLPEYRRINPLGGVPTLVHGDLVLSQSYSIIEYLDAAFPQSFPLFPKNPFERAKVSQFCQIINADMHGYGNLKTHQYLEKNFGMDISAKERFTSRFFTEGFEAIEAFITEFGSTYSFGSSITAADCFLVPVVFTAQRFKVPLERFPKLMKVNDTLLNESSIQKSHPFRQIDTPEDLRIK